MNDIIDQDYIQSLLNEYLIIDIELIPWKLVNRSNYYYMHNIYIMYINTKKFNNVLKYTNIVSINTNSYIQKNNLYYYKQCKCGLSNMIRTSFDTDFFKQDLPHLKLLRMSHMNNHGDPKLGSLISKLSSLEYLDLGINTYIDDSCFKKLSNLKTLYLRNNFNTEKIFKYLPSLKTIQIGYEIDTNTHYIYPDYIPNYINKIIQNGYSYECSEYGWQERDGCEPIYQHEEYSIVLK